MKNLLNHLSLEDIEKIPTIRTKGKFLNGKVVMRGWWMTKSRWDNKTYNQMHELAQRIIRGSVGKKWNDIHSKICGLVRSARFDITVDEIIRKVVIPYWNIRENRWYGYRYYGDHFDLYNMIKLVKSGKSYSFHPYLSELYWVCPYSGRLKFAKEKAKPPLTKKEIRYYHEKRTQKRKSNKQHRDQKKIKGLSQLSMINNPLLYEFYNDIYKKVRYIEVDQYGYHWRKKGSKDIWDRMREEDDQRKLAILKPQLKALETGDYTSFYQSDPYIKSIPRECHHFAHI